MNKSLFGVEAQLKRIIKYKGPITISEFISEALHNKDHGYYVNKPPIGADADFITSPEISQLFGEMIGIWFAYTWKQMGSPKNLLLVELGPGNGTLMSDVLRATKHINNFHDSISINFIEINKILRQHQEKAVSTYEVASYWHDDLYSLADGPLLLIANEFFDALPINQYIKLKNDWYEIKLALSSNEETFQFTYHLLDAKDIEFLTADYSHSKDGDIIETSPATILVAQELANRVANFGGAGLIIDYGYDSLQRNYISSLQAIKKHKYHPILENIGEVDLTSYVDFLALKQVFNSRAIKSFGTINQGDFLRNIGIELRAKLLTKTLDAEKKYNILNSLDRLINPNKMGNLFKVLGFCDKNLYSNLLGFN